MTGVTFISATIIPPAQMLGTHGYFKIDLEELGLIYKKNCFAYYNITLNNNRHDKK